MLNMMISLSERRKFRRVKVAFSLRYRVIQPLYVRMRAMNPDINAVMLDISEIGMAVSTNYNIPAGTVLFMRFILIDEAAVNDEESIHHLQVEGRVYDNFLLDDQEYRLGLRFIDISSDARLKIAKFVSMM